MFKKLLKLANKYLKRTGLKLSSFFKLPKNKFLSSQKIKELKKNKDNIKDNFGVFVKEQRREVKELVTGEQSFNKYCNDAGLLFKEYFIPSDVNDNRPRILRSKQLTIIAILLIVLKISLVGYLFSVYQRTAEMSQTTVNQILILTNESRVVSGAKPVALNSALNQAAQSKAEDMLINNYFSHTSPDGRKPWNFVNRSAYPYLLVGENLGMNFIAAADVHAALMASPSHKKNLLNPKYTDVGLAVLNGELDGKNTNILVQIFAYQSEPKETIAITPTASGSETFKAVIVDSEVLTLASESKEPDLVATPDKTNDSVSTIISIPDTAVVTNNTPDFAPISNNPSNQTPISNSITTTTNINSAQPGDIVASTEEIIVASETEAEVDVLAQSQGVILPVFSTINLPAEELNNEIINNDSDLALPDNTTEAPVEDILSEAELHLEPVQIATTSNDKISRAALILKISKLLYVFFLVFLIISLLINIFVRIAVQHKSVIFQALLLIVLLLALILFDFGFMTEIKNAANNIVLF